MKKTFLLGIQQSNTISSDLLISQDWDLVTVTANRTIDQLSSLYVMMMYDPERIDATQLSIQTSYDDATVFQDSQWSVVLTFQDGIQQWSELFVLSWIPSDEDLIIADIQATFSDDTTQRLLFAQP